MLKSRPVSQSKLAAARVPFKRTEARVQFKLAAEKV
jgi:hypothetical protein